VAFDFFNIIVPPFLGCGDKMAFCSEETVYPTSLPLNFTNVFTLCTRVMSALLLKPKEESNVLLLDGKDTAYSMSPFGLRYHTEDIAGHLQTAVVLVRHRLDTVAQCQTALAENDKCNTDGDFFVPRWRGQVADVHIYVLLTFSKQKPCDDNAYRNILFNFPPPLCREELQRRASKCRHLYCDGGIFIAHLPDDVHGVSYTWSSKERKIDTVTDLSHITKVGEYPTFHSYGYVGFFKPSVAEVMQHLPATLFANEEKRYLIDTKPMTYDAPDLHVCHRYHMGVTTVWEDDGDDIRLKDAKRSHEAAFADVSPETCHICMDELADTMVLPCQHQVVCRQCSDKLKHTADAKKCVRCRRPITEILMNE
jgi:hypothetical protein